MSISQPNDLHLLDISVRPCAYVKDVIQGSWNNLKEGVAVGGRGRKVHGFEIVGENRLIAVLDGNIESAVDSVNAAYGDQVSLKCTPLRTYEGFAERVLGVDKSLTEIVIPRKLSADGKMLWTHLKVNYRGLSVSDLIAVWAKEASTILTLRSCGNVELDLFKVVGQREVHVFGKMLDAEATDNRTFTLPGLKELGNQIEITTKSIVHLDTLTA